MSTDALRFLVLHRQIFGICPKCLEFFRLSDCRVFAWKKPTQDWMDKLVSDGDRLDARMQSLREGEEELREGARGKGRYVAQLVARKVDPVFTPHKLNPDDAKVIFHPIDYVVFNGMKEGKMKNVILLDRQRERAEHQRVQRSIERAVERDRYEWQTLRIQDDGKFIME
jgi:predicted Holliday junction resolvase-like endonuclease